MMITTTTTTNEIFPLLHAAQGSGKLTKTGAADGDDETPHIPQMPHAIGANEGEEDVCIS